MEPNPNDPKIILWDLEIIPDLRQALKYWNKLSNFPGLTLKANVTSVCCFGWKILGQKKTHCLNAWDFPSWNKNVNDDKEFCAAIADVLRSADCHVFHNGKRFDSKYIQTRLAIHKLPFIQKIPNVDTCTESKKHLFMINNRLQTLSDELTEQKKMDNDGWDLWVRTHDREEKAMKQMEAYCKQDVRALEELFLALRPLVTSLPNYNRFVDPALGQCCPNCGNANMNRNGTRVQKNTLYQMWVCRNCGTFSQTATKSLSTPRRTL